MSQSSGRKSLMEGMDASAVGHRERSHCSVMISVGWEEEERQSWQWKQDLQSTEA